MLTVAVIVCGRSNAQPSAARQYLFHKPDGATGPAMDMTDRRYDLKYVAIGGHDAGKFFRIHSENQMKQACRVQRVCLKSACRGVACRNLEIFKKTVVFTEVMNQIAYLNQLSLP